MPTRKSKVDMSGFDMFDIFGRKPEEKPRPQGLPAPKSRLPALRKEGGAIIPAPRKETLKEKFLSIFQGFGPKEETKNLPIPVEAEETEKGSPWEMMFSPSPEQEGRPIYEVQRGESPRYEFVHSGIRKIPYGEQEWDFPSVELMAAQLRSKMDVDGIFGKLGDIRSTEGYQDLLAEYAFRGAPLYTPLDIIDRENFYTDFAYFYDIPWSVVEAYPGGSFLTEVIRPLNIILTEAFELIKPEFLPGFFMVDIDQASGKHWLYYVEPWLGRLPGP